MPREDATIALAENARAKPITDERGSTARSLREWLENEALLRPPPAVYPKILHEGRTTLFSGREKVGKSTAAGSVVSDASRGAPVLGVPLLEPRTTLWYAIDEHVADAVRRFASLGADLDRVVINNEPRTATDLLAAFAADLAKYPTVNGIVVDTLSRVFANSGVEPNSSRETEPVLARLVDFIHATETVGALFLYHTGKAGREYRGSTAIGATVDDILTLRRRGQQEEDDFDDESNSDDGRRLLIQDGRNLRGRLHLHCVGGRYELFDDAHPPREKIIQALTEHGSAGSRTELVRLAGIQKQKGLATIAELIGSGAIVEKGTGRLVIGSTGSMRFPERRTAPEPHSGTDPLALPVIGSRFRDPYPTETGTGDVLDEAI